MNEVLLLLVVGAARYGVAVEMLECPVSSRDFNQLSNAAVLLAKQGVTVAAKACLQDAIEASSIAWYNMASLHLQERKFEDAAKYGGQAVELRPQDTDSYSVLGRALFALGKTDEATEIYNKALSFKPDWSEGRTELLNKGKKQCAVDEQGNQNCEDEDTAIVKGANIQDVLDATTSLASCSTEAEAAAVVAKLTQDSKASLKEVLPLPLKEADVAYAVQNKWWKVARKTVEFLRSKNVVIGSETRQVAIDMRDEATTVLNMIRQTKMDEATIQCSLMWAQSETELIVSIKFAARLDAPVTVLNVDNEKVDMNSTHVYFEGIGRQKPKKYVMDIELLKPIDPDQSSWKWGSVGTVLFTLKKTVPGKWERLLKTEAAPKNHRIWWEKQDQIKDNEQKAKEKAKKDREDEEKRKREEEEQKQKKEKEERERERKDKSRNMMNELFNWVDELAALTTENRTAIREEALVTAQSLLAHHHLGGNGTYQNTTSAALEMIERLANKVAADPPADEPAPFPTDTKTDADATQQPPSDEDPQPSPAPPPSKAANLTHAVQTFKGMYRTIALGPDNKQEGEASKAKAKKKTKKKGKKKAKREAGKQV